MVGIVSYGFYVPRFRITTQEIANAQGKSASLVSSSLRIDQKAVANIDEDAITMAYESAAKALLCFQNDNKEIDAVYFGSETSPYAVNPASTIVAEWLGITDHSYQAFDTQFACKAATGAMLAAAAQIKSGDCRNSLIIGSDKANAKPNDVLEFSAGAGSVAIILGSQNPLATIDGFVSYSSDTPDFWRRARATNPSHAGRFTGKPAYFTHITNASNLLLKKLGKKPSDFTYCVFHMPNGRFPRDVSKAIGFNQKQLDPSLVVEQFGNSYTASALMGLVAVLRKAKPGETIFFCSYGSGAGSDAIALTVTNEIRNIQCLSKTDSENTDHLTYYQYLRNMEAISTT